MFPSLRTFWVSSILLIIAVVLLAVYLYYDCMANPGCSGESGIVIVMLGLPWVMYPTFGSLGFFGSAGTAIMINIILLSFFIQVLRWVYLFFFPRDTSAQSKGGS